ncbi:MAG: alginate export family protein [Alphaproteobacteria bacterium]|nr:alginate export family protein [Alphaproteobacteria bacterium]
MRRLLPLCVALVAAAAFPPPAHALFDCPVEPVLSRYDDRKACPVVGADDGTLRLTLGGEIRQRYEYTHNPGFGDDPQDEAGVWLQRYTAHADLGLGDHLRIFGQLSSANEIGRKAGPSPVDEDRLAVQNLFVELRDLGGIAGLRAGRQEMRLGSGRLIDMREGPNVRRTFDAVRFGVDSALGVVTGLAARPVVPLPGSFDNTPSDDERLFGAYATAREGVLPLGQADFYVLRYVDEGARYFQGRGEERRTSVGLRAFGAAGNWDWNWEGVYQVGDFDGGDIRAWTFASDTGYRFRTLAWAPRLGVSANIASGDSDPSDNRLETFNPMFPRGNYFSEAAVLGPRNFYNVRPSVSTAPLPGVSVGTDVNVFWRLEEADAVYGPPGQIVRSGGDGRHVGTAWSVNAAYEMSPRAAFSIVFTHFFPGKVIQSTGPDEAITFVEATFQFRF